MPTRSIGRCGNCCGGCEIVAVRGYWFSAPGASDYNNMNGLPTSVRFAVRYGGVDYELAYALTSGPALILYPPYPATAPFPANGGAFSYSGPAMFHPNKRVSVMIAGATMIKVGEQTVSYQWRGGGTWTQGMYQMNIENATTLCSVEDA